mgnify:FL=1
MPPPDSDSPPPTPTPTHSESELDAAIERLSDPERFRQAEAAIAAAAPRLQQVLVQALGEGGWFAESHEDELRKALERDEPAERLRATRTLFAEEARVGMLVGVAVGWALREELNRESAETTETMEDHR